VVHRREGMEEIGPQQGVETLEHGSSCRGTIRRAGQSALPDPQLGHGLPPRWWPCGPSRQWGSLLTRYVRSRALPIDNVDSSD
jgi:hypothetical protein